MCLGVPGKVLEVDGLNAVVDFFGVKKQIRLDIVNEEVRVGDYILNHVGFAIHRIPEDEIEETLSLFDTILKEAQPGDLMAEDVRTEMEGPRAAAMRKATGGGQ